MKDIFINIAVYQIIWIICVTQWTYYIPTSLLLLLLHFLLSKNRREEATLLLCVTVTGIIIDGTLRALDFVVFRDDGFPIPLWLAFIWMALSTLPHNSLKWMKSRPLTSILFGGIGGPLAYGAGVALGSAEFSLPHYFSLGVLALIWAVLWPAIMYIAARQIPSTP